MLGAGVQRHLVGLLGGRQDLLRLVALLDGEDLVHLGGRDGQRAADGRELLLRDEAGVGDEADVDAVLVVADDVLFEASVSATILQIVLGIVVHSPWRRSSSRQHRSW